MRSYRIDAEPIRITINGIEFELLESDGAAQAKIMEYLARIAAEKMDNSERVEAALQTGCEMLDGMLGRGACHRIFGDTPISFRQLLPLMMQIARDCAKEYRRYLTREYLEGTE